MQRKVCLDTCIVIWAILDQGRAEDEAKRLKAAYLLSQLDEEKAKIFIPALVIAEITAKMAQEDRLELLNLLSLKARAEIMPFCTASALEYGTIRAIGKKMVNKKFSRKEMSFDSAIIATCKRHGVETIYTNDNNMRELAKAFMQVSDLPNIPPLMQPLPLE